MACGHVQGRRTSLCKSEVAFEKYVTPFEGTSTCIETARPLQLLEVLSSVCALVFLSSRSLTSLQTSGGPLTSSRITPDSLLPFVHPPPLSSIFK